MLKELWAYLRIVWVINRELDLKIKLLKHQGKMVDTWTEISHECSGKPFMLENVQYEFDKLESRIKSRFS